MSDCKHPQTDLSRNLSGMGEYCINCNALVKQYPGLPTYNPETHILIAREDTRLKDRMGKSIMVGNIVHWSDGGDDLSLDERIANRWDRIAVVHMDGIMPAFTVIDSPDEQTKAYGYTFNYGRFIYKDTENHLTIVADSRDEYDKRFKSAGDCMRYVAALLAEKV